MDIPKIKPLIKWLVDMGFTEIEIKKGDESLRVGRQDTHASHHHTPAHVHIPAHSAPPMPAAFPAASPATSAPEPVISGHPVLAPMVGTLYTSPSPETPPFITMGKQVKAGDTLCIIEAMKMFNEVEADRSGVITGILVANGDPVEFGQPLFIIE
jgi:acetyl-CoA carboxylase biotin carboxyl carrier protein